MFCLRTQRGCTDQGSNSRPSGPKSDALTTEPPRLSPGPLLSYSNTLFFQVANTYAFLPREAVSYYLMSCSTCKQRIQRFNSILLKHGRPLSPVSDLVSALFYTFYKVFSTGRDLSMNPILGLFARFSRAANWFCIHFY